MLTKLCAPTAIAGIVAGGVLAAPVVHAAHANVNMHVDVDLLADTAIFVGPTILSTPSATFARTAADLFLRPLGFDGDDFTSCLIGSATCDAPLQLLSTPGLIQVGHSSFAGAAEIVRTVQAELAANPGIYDADHPLWIFGYSQGATAGSIAMAQLAHDPDIPSGALHFVFIGDPTAPDGKYPHMEDDGTGHSNFSDSWMLYGKETPNDAFPTTIYTIPGDPNADYTSTSPYGDFYEHMMYLGLTPDQVANHTATTDDLLTTINISTDFDQFGAWLNAWGHGLADSSWWDGLFYSAVAFVYSAFGKLEDFFGDWMGLDWGGVEETLDYWFPTV